MNIIRALRNVARLLESEPEEGRYREGGTVIEVVEDRVEKGWEESSAGWSVLASRIVREIESDGFLGAICYGKLRAGKSLYTIKVVRDVLTLVGLRNDYNYIISELLFFDVMELIGILKTSNYSSKRVALIWDDAGVYGSSYLWFTDKKLYMALGRVLQVMASRLYSLLASTPKPEFVLKPFRNVDNYIIYVKKIDRLYSKAIGYELEYLPSGKLVVRKSFEDIFKRRIDPKAYSKYLEKRDSYVDITLELLLEELSKRRDVEKKVVEAVDEEDIEVELIPPMR